MGYEMNLWYHSSEATNLVHQQNLKSVQEAQERGPAGSGPSLALINLNFSPVIRHCHNRLKFWSVLEITDPIRQGR